MAGLARSRFTRVRHVLTTLFFIVGVAGSACVAMGAVYASRSGHEHIVVTGGSMEPTIAVREVITVDPSQSPDNGDIITFLRDGKFVTHRVVSTWTGTDPTGATRQLFSTKGDANTTLDPWTVTDSEILGTVVPTSAMISIAAELSMRPMLLALAVLPMLMGIFLKEIRHIAQWRLCPERESNPQSVATRGV
jgi:signal peptidase I